MSQLESVLQRNYRMHRMREHRSPIQQREHRSPIQQREHRSRSPVRRRWHSRNSSINSRPWAIVKRVSAEKRQLQQNCTHMALAFAKVMSGNLDQVRELKTRLNELQNELKDSRRDLNHHILELEIAYRQLKESKDSISSSDAD